MPAAGPSSARQVEQFFQISLVLLLASGFFSVLFAGQLDPFMAALVAAALLARLLGALDVYRLTIPKPFPSLLAIAYLGFYPLDCLYLSEEFVSATVRLMFFFTALKLVIARTGRDYFYLGVLAFLQLLTVSMFVAGVGFVGILLTFLFLAVTTYVSFEIKRGCESPARIVADRQAPVGRRLELRLAVLGGGLALGILVLSLGLFLVLPRVIGRTPISPLQSELTVAFASQVDLSLTGTLQPDYTPVMRIDELGGGSVEGLRWRGLALRDFDGVRWSDRPADPVTRIEPETGLYALRNWWRRSEVGRRIHYRITLEPLAVNALFLTGLPEEVTGTFDALYVSETDSLSVPVGDLRAQPLRYEAKSWISDRRFQQPANVAEIFSDRFRENYLQLPELDARIRQLALQVAGTSRPPLARAEALERYLRNEYGYTLELPARPSPDPLAHFLFERREGHCEYFASALAVMLRAIGIPARLVNGFAGGVHNPISGLHVIRSRDAHSWVEAYIPRYGWLEFDPTPPDPNVITDPWLAQMWMYWDAVQSAWRDWILDYDLGQQLVLARAIQSGSRSAVSSLAESLQSMTMRLWDLWDAWTPPAGGSPAGRWRNLLTIAVALAVGSMLLAWSFSRLLPRMLAAYRGRRLLEGRGRPSDCSYLYSRALGALQRRGMAREPWQTPEEFARSVSKPEYQGLFKEITAAYSAARFGHDRLAEQRLPQLVQALERVRA